MAGSPDVAANAAARDTAEVAMETELASVPLCRVLEARGGPLTEAELWAVCLRTVDAARCARDTDNDRGGGPVLATPSTVHLCPSGASANLTMPFRCALFCFWFCIAPIHAPRKAARCGRQFCTFASPALIMLTIEPFSSHAYSGIRFDGRML